MRRKNPTIKSFIVRRKNDPLIKIDTEFFSGECFDTGDSLIVTSDPFFKPWDSLKSGAWWFTSIDPVGNKRRHSCGDLGIPGYAYDGRPNLFCLSKEEREIVSEKHQNWLDQQDDDSHYY